MNERPRSAALDVLKCVAMLSVCLYHFPLIGGAAYADVMPLGVLAGRYLRGMNAVCVPLFMMVNGALLLNRPFDAKKHIRRTLSLAAGVYVWYVITQLIGHLARDGAAYVASNLPGILHSALYLYEYDGVALTHLWFVQMLAALYLLLPLIRAAMDVRDPQLRMGMGFGLGALAVLAFLVHDFEHVRGVLPVLKYLDLSCVETWNPLRGVYGAMAVYFVLGGLMMRHADGLRLLPLWVPVSMIAGGSAVLFAEWLCMAKQTKTMYDIVYYGYNCLPTMAMSAGAFILALKYADALPRAAKRLAAFVGRNTLAVYYIHWILGLLFLDGAQLPGSLPLNLAKAAVMTLAGALVGEGLRRIRPLRWLV
ncbi:MAG: acyltransferase [Clostridia bacterium]|nr:acyltransferase [Clostridia bacterium]